MTMNDDAIALHEVFTSLISAGFTEKQAMDLVTKLLLAQAPDQD